MTKDQIFVERLLQLVPELKPTFDEHLKHYDELLPHVFMGDVTQWAIGQASNEDSRDALVRLIDSLEGGLCTGSPEVRDLILCSFVENLIGEGAPAKLLTDLTGPKLRDAIQSELGIL